MICIQPVLISPLSVNFLAIHERAYKLYILTLHDPFGGARFWLHLWPVCNLIQIFADHELLYFWLSVFNAIYEIYIPRKII